MRMGANGRELKGEMGLGEEAGAGVRRVNKKHEMGGKVGFGGPESRLS